MQKKSKEKNTFLWSTQDKQTFFKQKKNTVENFEIFSATVSPAIAATITVIGAKTLPLAGFTAGTASLGTLAAATATGAAIMYLPTLLLMGWTHEKLYDTKPLLCTTLNTLIFLSSLYCASLIGALVFKLAIDPVQECMLSGNITLTLALVALSILVGCVLVACSFATPKTNPVHNKNSTAVDKDKWASYSPMQFRSSIKNQDNNGSLQKTTYTSIVNQQSY